MYSQIYAFEVLPERREEFIALMQRHIAECLREEPGPLDFRFLQDETDPNRFYDFETYADEAALAAHRAPGSALARNGPLAYQMMVGGRGTFIARGFQPPPAAGIAAPEP